MERLSLLDIAAQMIATARKRPIAQRVALCEGAGVLLDHARRNGVAEEAPQKKTRRGRKPRRLAARKRRVKSAHKPPAAAVAPEAPAAGREINAHGVMISTEVENERIVCGERVMEITDQQAKLLAMLLRAYPEPVGCDWLVKQLGISRKALHALAADSKQACGAVTLGLQTIRGVGYALLIPVEARA